MLGLTNNGGGSDGALSESARLLKCTDCYAGSARSNYYPASGYLPPETPPFSSRMIFLVCKVHMQQCDRQTRSGRSGVHPATHAGFRMTRKSHNAGLECAVRP